MRYRGHTMHRHSENTSCKFHCTALSPKVIQKIVLNSWHIKRLGSKTVRVASSFVLLHKNPKLFVDNIPLNLIFQFPWSANNKLIVVLRCSKTIEPLASEVTLQHSFLWMMAFHSSWLWEQSGAEQAILHQQHWWDLCQVSGWVSPRPGLMGCSWVGSWVNMAKWRDGSIPWTLLKVNVDKIWSP